MYTTQHPLPDICTPSVGTTFNKKADTRINYLHWSYECVYVYIGATSASEDSTQHISTSIFFTILTHICELFPLVLSAPKKDIYSNKLTYNGQGMSVSRSCLFYEQARSKSIHSHPNNSTSTVFSTLDFHIAIGVSRYPNHVLYLKPSKQRWGMDSSCYQGFIRTCY